MSPTVTYRQDGTIMSVDVGEKCYFTSSSRDMVSIARRTHASDPNPRELAGRVLAVAMRVVTVLPAQGQE